VHERREVEMKESYGTPVLTSYGSVVSMTMGGFGSDTDGSSGRLGNQSNSDNTGGGCNDGSCNPPPRGRR
jgi:hypothetical protein